jgi:hypothetical protein
MFRRKKKSTPQESSKEVVRSWSVNVTDETRSAPPYMWPLAAYETKQEAEVSLQEYRKSCADKKHLRFDIYPSELEAPRVIPWFENYWGLRPDIGVRP